DVGGVADVEVGDAVAVHVAGRGDEEPAEVAARRLRLQGGEDRQPGRAREDVGEAVPDRAGVARADDEVAAAVPVEGADAGDARPEEVADDLTIEAMEERAVPPRVDVGAAALELELAGARGADDEVGAAVAIGVADARDREAEEVAAGLAL